MRFNHKSMGISRLVVGAALALGLAVNSNTHANKQDKPEAKVAAPQVANVTAPGPDVFAERESLLAAYKDRDVLTVGFFPGTTSLEGSDVYALLRKYMPLSNYLTKESGKVVVLLPEKNVLNFKRRAVAERYPYIYVNAEIAASAALAGYTPIVARAQNIESVFVTKADSKLSKPEDLKGRSVGMVEQAMVSTLAKHTIYKAGLWSAVKVVPAASSGSAALTTLLDNGQADVVVMRRENAEDVIKAKPNAYKVAMASAAAPGFILMARKDVSAPEAQRLAAAFMKVDKSDKSMARIAGALDVLSDGAAFRPIGDKEIKEMVAVLSDLSPLEPSRNYIVTPKAK